MSIAPTLQSNIKKFCAITKGQQTYFLTPQKPNILIFNLCNSDLTPKSQNNAPSFKLVEGEGRPWQMQLRKQNMSCA